MADINLTIPIITLKFNRLKLSNQKAEIVREKKKRMHQDPMIL